MKNQHFFIVLILLISTFSLNHGQKMNDIISKFNERRAAGILAQPRVGRTTGMANFGRPEGLAGLVHYPRVGRSGLLPSFANFNHEAAVGLEETPELSNHHEIDLAYLVNLGYPKYPYISDDEQQQQFNIMMKNEPWMAIEQLRHGIPKKDQPHLRLQNHCLDRALDEVAWSLLFAPSKGSAQLEEQSAHNDVPRATREIDHAQ